MAQGDGAGRPTDLTDELIKQIKQSILEGNNLKETANIIGKTPEVLYVWHSDNYLGIADKIEGWRRDRKLNLAEANIEEILKMDKRDEVLRVVSDMSKFVAETLGKSNYAKRTENTGKDGESLFPKPLLAGNSNVIQDNNRNEEATSVEETD